MSEVFFSMIIFIKKHYFSTVLDCFKVMLFLVFAEMFLQLYAKLKILYFFILCENFFDFVRKATIIMKIHIMRPVQEVN